MCRQDKAVCRFTKAVGAAVITWVKRWRLRTLQQGPVREEDLDTYRALYEEGTLSQEEFDRIRARLSEQLRQEMDLPAPAPPAEFKDEPPAKDGQSGKAPPAGSLPDQARGREPPPASR